MAAYVALITGANKGLGYEVVKQLATSHPDWIILVGSRVAANGEAAIKKLSADNVPTKNVKSLVIDVNSQASITAAAVTVKKDYGHVDLLIDNAGVYPHNMLTPEGTKDTLETNYFGVRHTNDTFLPLLSAHARIVVVSSTIGAWTHQVVPAVTRARLDAASTDLTIAEVDALAHDYVESVKTKVHTDRFPPPTGPYYSAYGVSKTLVSTYSRVLARDIKKTTGKDITVVIVCPGYCATDINAHKGYRTAVEGATSIIVGVTVPHAEGHGKFFSEGKEHPTAADIPEAFKAGL